MSKSYKKYKIDFVDRVLDPVHGFIDLTKVESEIYKLRIFRRLASIKQLGLTNWIFPGSEHTRFIHSLGVMHICDEMAKNLRNLDGSPRCNDGMRQTIRLAGLLHDIGHYPLSHITEEVYIQEDGLTGVNNILNNYHNSVVEQIQKLDSKKTPEYMKSRYSKPMHHESIGTKVIVNDKEIKDIIKRYCPFVKIEDICDIIVGCVDNVIDPLDGTVNNDLSVMIQLMHAELDADGIDYLLRDASFSGTTYGTFTLGLLLRNLVVSKYNSVEIVGVKPKGISTIDQYLLGKYLSYTQVIFNRHVAVLELMAQILTHYLMRGNVEKGYYAPEDLLHYIENHEKVDDFIRFTDRKFWTCLDQNDVDHANLNGKFLGIIIKRLKDYQELPMKENGELVWINDSPSEVYKSIVNSDMYHSLEEKPEKALFIFHKREFTSELPEKEFEDIVFDIRNINDKESEEFKNENIRRLQEGISVVESDGSIHLLIDDPRSMISHMKHAATYIFREYKIE